MRHSPKIKRLYDKFMRDSPECRGCFLIDDFAKELFIKKLDKVKPELRNYIDLRSRSIPELADLLLQQADITDSRA